MKRHVVALAAMSMLALSLGAAPVSAGAVQHFTFLATEAGNADDPSGPMVLTCGSNTYTATAGWFSIVTRDPSLAAHMTAHGVRAVNQDGAAYRVVGAETYNDPAGRLTAKLVFVGRAGGIADSINIVLRANDDGSLRFGHDRGTCGF
jgi:hypothetical protein